ncbi:hypothetical protein [Sphingomonas sp.]|uniref:hypothetical protein n=1 Tax=Sphingomonas sp. TaxID=28214 RepID=UPI00258D5BD6|nr:hypothetical protein [Sphingomonas sp.]
MRQCFKEVGIDAPDMSVYLPRLAAKKPPQLIREKGGYRLAGAVRRVLDIKLGGDPTTLAVAKALTDLPARLPDIAEREFLTEALNCYRVRAYRAAVIMAWNLTYDHFVRWVFADPGRLASMNTGISAKYQKKNLTLAKHEDADNLKESEFIEAARAGNLLDKNTAQILREKLGRRNMAAHPSRVTISQHSADEMITDLVTNVILKLG